MLKKNSCMFEFPAFLPPTNLGQQMDSPSALTEYVSLNLAKFFYLLDPVDTFNNKSLRARTTFVFAAAAAASLLLRWRHSVMATFTKGEEEPLMCQGLKEHRFPHCLCLSSYMKGSREEGNGMAFAIRKITMRFGQYVKYATGNRGHLLPKEIN